MFACAAEQGIGRSMLWTSAPGGPIYLRGGADEYTTAVPLRMHVPPPGSTCTSHHLRNLIGATQTARRHRRILLPHPVGQNLWN